MFDFNEMNNLLVEDKQMTVFEASAQLLSKVNISRIASMADSAEVSSENDARQVLSMSLQARKMRNELESIRKEIVTPHIEFQRAVNKVANELETSLEDIEIRLKNKIEFWIGEENVKDQVIEVEDGSLYAVSKYNYELIDMNRIPKEYLSINEKKVKDAIKNGIRNIPGLIINQSKELAMRVKN